MKDGRTASERHDSRTSPEFMERLSEGLGASGPRSPAWDAPARFVRAHDIIVLVGDLPARHVEDEPTPPDVVESVVSAAVDNGVVHSAVACDEWGLATCLARCCRDGGMGCLLMLDETQVEPDMSFADARGRAIVTVASSQVDVLADMFDDVDVPYAALGQVGGSRAVALGMPSGVRYVDLDVSEL